MVNSEALKLLCRILEDDFSQITDFISLRTGESFEKVEVKKTDAEDDNLDLRIFFSGSIADSGDMDDYISSITGLIRKSPARFHQDLYSHIKAFLGIRIKEHGRLSPSEIERNLQRVKETFNLTDTEAELVLFLFIISNWEPAENYFQNYLESHKYLGRKYLCALLQVSPNELEKMLMGTLSRIEMIENDWHSISLEGNFSKLLQVCDTRSFIKNYYAPIPRNSIPLENYFIDRKQIDYLSTILKEKQGTATHILFYGPPGTGKTSFAYGLAHSLKIPAYEIVSGEDGKSKNRRAAIVACLNMTNKKDGAIVIVDEADNLLNTGNSWFERGESQDKGWLNKFLEEPETRIIWITNRICGIEDSVMRRFSYSLHFRPFNRTQRMRLWENILRRNKVKKMIGEADISSLAERYKVNAGVMDVAVKKARESGVKGKKEFLEAVIISLEANQVLINGGQKRVDKDTVEKNYSLEGLNVEGDVKLVMNQLEEFSRYLENSGHEEAKNINLLFHGPPGSGKSELARYIARHLDRQLISKRLSDILNPYVGVTEMQLRDAFSEAEREGAILIFDEADSMLFSRDRAQHSWEISHTNEFLTQMERFRGILICTTNRLRDLDDASIRRFNHKIGFDFLKPEGNVIFYRKMLSTLTSEPLTAPIEEELRKINDLAPGDFSIVRDRFSFYDEKKIHHKLIIDALRQESVIKRIHQGKKHIGF